MTSENTDLELFASAGRSEPFVYPTKSEDLCRVTDIPDGSVALVLTDPPYFGIVDDAWDNQWSTASHYATWLVSTLCVWLPKLTPTGSLVIFSGIGKHGEHPIFQVITGLEYGGYTYRNWTTWKKRRAYGKSHDYLFLREEILWFSKSAERTKVTFNKPYTDVKRGYAGFSAKYPAHSEFKRVGNVWTDIDPVIEDCPELMRPKRSCQKPPALMERLVSTHSNPGDLIVDPFAGWGSTGISAVKLGRRFVGCEAIEEDALAADQRVREAVPTPPGVGKPSTS